MRDKISIYKAVIEVFERTFNDVTKEQVEEKRRNGCYPFIPLSMETFIDQVKTVDLALEVDGVQKRNFIDVGCGIGTKLFAAHAILNETYRSNKKPHIKGIDIDPNYIKKVEHILANQIDLFYSRRTIVEGIELEVADARTYNFAPHNIVYFYCPMLTPALEQVLEARIMKTVRLGSYVLANGSQTYDASIWREAGFRPLHNDYGAQIFKRVKKAKA